MNDFKEIYIAYFHLTQLKGLSFTHGTKYPFSVRKLNSIIKKVLENGYNVMLVNGTKELENGDIEKNIIVSIDNGMFRQR